MMKMNERKNPRRPMPLQRKIKIAGYLFLSPWLLGLLYFFLYPFAITVIDSFHKVSLGQSGLAREFLGLENFKYILLVDANFTRNVVSEIGNLFSSVPIILIFSVFVAMILNQNFKGRLFARSLFFIPVIIASGVVIQIIQNDLFTKNGLGGGGSIFQASALTDALFQLSFAQGAVEFIAGLVSRIFDLTWKSGVQILLFLSALQRIPSTYYEVAAVEGANSWDSFWKITFPVLSPSLLLIGVYTIVDVFMNQENPVMKGILSRFQDLDYGRASASALLYFMVIAVILLLLVLLTRKKEKNP